MADLVRLSGIANGSYVLQTLQLKGVDEGFLSKLSLAQADDRLAAYGIHLAVQRFAILECVLPGKGFHCSSINM